MADWKIDGVYQGFIGQYQGAPGNTYSFNHVTANHTIQPYLSRYSVITASAGPGGAISPSGGVDVGIFFPQPFSITPNQGYTIAQVLIDGAAVMPPPSSYTFNDVYQAHTIAVTFTPVADYTIKATAGTGGMISPSGAVSVKTGTNQNFIITPQAGYNIQQVLVDGSPLAIKNTVSPMRYVFSKVEAAHSISASFTKAGTIKIIPAPSPS